MFLRASQPLACSLLLGFSSSHSLTHSRSLARLSGPALNLPEVSTEAVLRSTQLARRLAEFRQLLKDCLPYASAAAEAPEYCLRICCEVRAHAHMRAVLGLGNCAVSQSCSLPIPQPCSFVGRTEKQTLIHSTRRGVGAAIGAAICFVALLCVSWLGAVGCSRPGQRCVLLLCLAHDLVDDVLSRLFVESRTCHRRWIAWWRTLGGTWTVSRFGLRDSRYCTRVHTGGQ